MISTYVKGRTFRCRLMHPAELKLDRQWWTRLVPYSWRRGGPLLVAERPAEWSLTRGGTTQQVVPCSWREHLLVVPYSWRLTEKVASATFLGQTYKTITCGCFRPAGVAVLGQRSQIGRVAIF